MSVSFNAATTFPLGLNPNSVVVVDVNGDGNLDIVSGGTIAQAGTFLTTGGLSTLLGNGAGGFGAAVTSSGSQFGAATSIATGDFNGDGLLDVITTGNVFGTTASDVFVALGNGQGRFRPGSSLLVGNSPQSVATGDLNGDGRLDAVTANSGGSTISVLLGDGAGNLTAQSLAVAGSPKSVLLRDLNGDTRLDILALTIARSSSGVDTASLTILRGDGRGAFTPTTPIEIGTGSTYGASKLVTADFNGDGRIDVASLSGRRITVLLGDGQTFRPVFQTEQTANSLTTGDFNGDGRLDLAIGSGSYGSGTNSVLLGNGQGGFSRPVSFAAAGNFGGTEVAATDFNKDNKLDLVSVGGSSPEATVLLNNTTQTDAIAQSTTGIDSIGFIDASSELSGSVNIDLNKGTFVLNGPVRIERSLQGVDQATGTVFNDKIAGNRRDNLLQGNLGNDEITGGLGNDRIVGGGGNDRLTGGRGRDRFIFTSTPNYPEGLNTPFSRRLLGVDRILDFERGRDKIVLDTGTFTALEAGKRIRFAVVDDIAEARTSRGIITYVRETGRIYYNPNGARAGFGAGGFFAEVTDNLALAARDFATFA